MVSAINQKMIEMCEITRSKKFETSIPNIRTFDYDLGHVCQISNAQLLVKGTIKGNADKIF